MADPKTSLWIIHHRNHQTQHNEHVDLIKNIVHVCTFSQRHHNFVSKFDSSVNVVLKAEFREVQVQVSILNEGVSM